MAATDKSSPGANFGWLMAERGWRVLLGLAVNVAVARHVGPAQFGMLSYALGLIAIFWAVGGLGLDEVLTRELVRDRARARALLAVALRLKTAGAAGAFVALLVVAWVWRPEAEGAWLVVVLAGGGLFFLPLDVVSRLYTAMQAGSAQLAVAKTGDQAHPVFCLCERSLLPHLTGFLVAGGRKIDRWYASLNIVEVSFDDVTAAFSNINSPQELAAFEQIPPVA